MIDRFLRKMTVSRRIIGGFLMLVLLLALAIPLIIADHSFIVGRLQRVTDVETYADRLLLLALARIMSSRLNLLRYLQDYLPSSWESLTDADQATELLIEAQNLITLPDQKAAVASVLKALADYKTLISDVQTARQKGRSIEATRLVFLASKTGNNIGQQIEQIVKNSEAHVISTNKTVYAEAQRRLMFIVGGYLSVLILSLLLSRSVARSITQPVSELRNGAEAFRVGYLNTVIPATGADELSLLAHTFNQMAEQLQESFATLEQREQTLAEERNLLRTLIDNVPDLIYVKDTESRMLLVNTAVKQALGVATPDEIVGKTDFDLLPKEFAEQFYTSERDIFESGQPLINREEHSADVKTGTTLWLSTTKVPFRDSQGNIAGLVGISRDITELKRVQEELQTLNEELEQRVKERTRQLEEAHAQIVKLEKNALEVQMAGGFAHEMRNALAGTKLVLNAVMDNEKTVCQKNLELLERVFSNLEPHIPERSWDGVIDVFQTLAHQEEEVANVLNMIAYNTNQAMEVTTLILDYARVGQAVAGNDPVDIQHVVEQIVQQYTAPFAEHDIALRLHGTTDNFLRGDESHFFAMINNLVLNAHNALLEVTDERERWIEITLKEDEYRQIVQIRDTANGISEEYRQRIFEPFFSTNPTTGVGLGLCFVAKLVSLYHGTVEVESEEGKGTTFWMTFPYK